MNVIDIRPAVTEFQERMGINVTGTLNAETIEVMNMPRCGNKDIGSDTPSTRVKRFKPNGLKWDKRQISYQISSYSRGSNLDPNDIHLFVGKAFQLWEKATDLKFVELQRNSPQEVDIDVQFTAFDHGDNSPFDGRGVILAHAFGPGPGLGGDIHIDDSEHWTVGSALGTNLYSATVHEIGHSLGLSHSRDRGAIMFELYPPFNPSVELELGSDDVAGIQSIYGPNPQYATARIRPPSRPTSSPPKVTKPVMTSFSSKPRPVSRPDLCKDPRMDAITTTPSKAIYIFKDTYVYKIEPFGSGAVNSLHKTAYVFRGLHGKIDAAMTRKNGATYFFQKDKYWRFHETKQDANYPKKISKHFPGVPSSIDAVFEWPNDDQIYFFKGNTYWVFNPFARENGPSVAISKPLSTLGLPVDSIDAAFVDPNGRTYLFKDSHYWRLSVFEFRIADPRPRRIQYACSNSNLVSFNLQM